MRLFYSYNGYFIIDVIETIRAHTYRIKLYRNFVRNVKAQSWSPFNHRTS